MSVDEFAHAAEFLENPPSTMIAMRRANLHMHEVATQATQEAHALRQELIDQQKALDKANARAGSLRAALVEMWEQFAYENGNGSGTRHTGGMSALETCRRTLQETAAEPETEQPAERQTR